MNVERWETVIVERHAQARLERVLWGFALAAFLIGLVLIALTAVRDKSGVESRPSTSYWDSKEGGH
jgi:hypothetical protein